MANLPEYCLFWVQAWCMPRSDWASWVQAVGSILAILGAIGIAMWQRHRDHADAAQRARVRAQLASTSLRLKLQPTLSLLANVERDVRGHVLNGATFHKQGAGEAMLNMPYPDDNELQAILEFDPQTAQLLMQGRLAALHAGETLRVSSMTREQWTQLIDLLGSAQQVLSDAVARLVRLGPGTVT
jgi:hypothetical protein